MIIDSIKSEYQRYKSLTEAAIAQVKDGDLHKVIGEDNNSIAVIIRGKELTVAGALQRSLAHAAYHVGQIVLLARIHAGREWKSLSIPRGKSPEYNLNPTKEWPSGTRR